MKKIIALVLALCLVLGVGMVSTGAAEGEPMVITIFGTDISTGEQSLTDEAGDFPSWKALEEKFNVDLQFNATTSYGSSIEVRLASGEQLEDLFCIAYTGILQYASEGLFMPLDDLIAAHAPNLTAYYEENPSSRLYNVLPTDGKQYAISENEYYYKTLGDVWAWFIRQDWLDELGLAVPTTTDELFDALMAFKENGMGGGAPVITTQSSGSIFDTFSWAFGMDGVYDGYYKAYDGTVRADLVTDQYKELLKYVHKLYENDLIDPQFPNNSNDIANETIAADNAALFCRQTSCINQHLKFYQAGNENVKLTVLGVLDDGNGNGKKFSCPDDWKRYIIPATVDEEKAARIIEILDYTMGTMEGIELMWYGPEGDIMEYDEEGVPYFIDDVRLANDASLWFNRGLQIQVIPTAYAPVTKYDTESWMWDIAAQTQALADASTPCTALGRFPRTESASEKISNEDLSTYVKEARMAFIMGDVDIDAGWDEYVQKCYDLGLETRVAGYQELADIFLK